VAIKWSKQKVIERVQQAMNEQPASAPAMDGQETIKKLLESARKKQGVPNA
jgi:hypothetical protein